MLFRSLLLCVWLSALAFGHAAAAGGFGTPTPGQHVYDHAGVLSAQQRSTIEQHAGALEDAGAPTVVLLQIKSASPSEATDDARALMDDWDVQSSGEHDGFVMVFDLNPGDMQHGNVGVFAGRAHTSSGALAEPELRRIVDEVMRPLLVSGDLSAAINAGLDATAEDVRNGAPTRSREGSSSRSIPRSDLAVLMGSLFLPFIMAPLVLIGIVVVLVVSASGRGGRRSGGSGSGWSSSGFSGGGSSGGDSASSGGSGAGSSF